MFKLHRGRIKRLSGHRFIHQDVRGLEYYMKLTDMFDISLLMYSPVDKSYREFIIDYAMFRAIGQFLDKRVIKPHAGLVDLNLKHPSIVDDYVNKGFTIIRKVGDARLANNVMVVKAFEFGEGVLSLVARRIVYTDTLIIGMDTAALQEDVCKAIYKGAEKLFGKENFSYIIKEEKDNASN